MLSLKGSLNLMLGLYINLLNIFYNVDFIAWMEPIINFFGSFGQIGLFFYAIIETITPLAGIEFFIVPMILSSAESWAWIAFIITLSNSIGAFIVYVFIAKEDNKIYKKLVNSKNQDKSRKMLNRYGFWAIFIFAMSPLPFFVILFTAAIANMKFIPFILSTIVSRGFRFFATSYFIHNAVVAGQRIDTGWIILWLTLIGVGFTVVMVFIQKLLLIYFEKRMENK